MHRKQGVEDSPAPASGGLCQRCFPFSPTPCTRDTISKETQAGAHHTHTSPAGTGDRGQGDIASQGSTHSCRDASPKPFRGHGAVRGCAAPQTHRGPSLFLLSSTTCQLWDTVDNPVIPSLGLSQTPTPQTTAPETRQHLIKHENKFS